ncbi:hypothetical protein O6H91_09G023900 [Diphasiastrum complanatum]|uniref:Uncharacterized protein n=1 Tax=Diphasiastrum complanatum TaxID=34168 RepID=A0ACC2CM49_DIPCM|nr:hypothetical protein O6H91_09G023900 [Diphasiastrum complanatum]
MTYDFRRGLRTMQVPAAWNPATMLSTLRKRQIQRALNNLKITLLCGFVTILVLRGTIGAGSFGTPAQDLNEIREFLPRRKEPARVLTEVKETFRREEPPEEEEVEDHSMGSSLPYSLGAKISDWNQQREEWLLKNPHRSSSVNEKPRILLVTGSQPKACDNPVGDHYLLKSIKNKIDYCRLHDVEIFYNMAHLDQEMAGFWSKLPLIRKLMLSHPDVEWIWWMDSDAMFTDMAFELPMDRYKDYNLVLHGWDELVYDRKNWIGLNTGSFLLRNCQWSLDLLDAWAPMGPKGEVRSQAGKLLTKSLAGRPAFEADDQSALVYLLATQRAVWGGKVYLENSYYLHGYWVIIVEKYEEMIEKYHPGFGDDRWPFVTHFVGCKPCGSYGDYPVDRCVKHMERAFNFADNQVLEMYGFRHRNLGTSKVKRIDNDTPHPLQLADQNPNSEAFS